MRRGISKGFRCLHLATKRVIRMSLASLRGARGPSSSHSPRASECTIDEAYRSLMIMCVYAVSHFAHILFHLHL